MPSEPHPIRDSVRVLVWFWGRRGGGPRYTFEIAQALAKLPSIEVHTSISPQSELFAETKALGLPGIDVSTFSDVFSGIWRSASVPGITSRFVGYLDEQDIDIVLCTMRHMWNVWVGRFVRSTKRRYILTLHDAEPHPGDSHPGWRRILRSELQHADGVIALSEHVRNKLTADFSYPRSRTFVASHGPFRFPGFSPDREAPARPRRLLFFGRLLPYKGLRLLLDAFSLVADRCDLELAVVGGGDLHGDVGRLLQHPRIRVDNRWVPEGEVAQVFAKADLVVAPYVEASQSGVVATAYGMGLPVVATPVGGLREQVVSGRTGMIADDKTPGALAEAILALCTDDSLYARCCEGAREAGEMESSWGAVAREISSAIDKVRSMEPFGGLARPAP